MVLEPPSKTLTLAALQSVGHRTGWVLCVEWHGQSLEVRVSRRSCRPRQQGGVTAHDPYDLLAGSLKRHLVTRRVFGPRRGGHAARGARHGGR